jgi:neutral ceramidase
MLRFSADFPGVMSKVVEQSFDGKPLVFFAQGAPGDINVYDATTPITQDAVGRRDWAGETLGKAAAETAKKIQTQADADPSIDFSEDILPFKLRWDPEKFRQEILREISPDAFKLYAPPIQQTMQLPVITALINRKIAIMTMPGEPFLEYQMNWRARCSLHDCLFLGYTNGYNGYFPTIQAGVEGGYGAASAATWVELGAGEEMVDHSLIELFRMLGRLQDAPRSDWKDLR